MGLLHIYYGDGKGKTTAAAGIAARAAGNGGRVIFAQFLKGRPTGEVSSLEKLGITVLRCDKTKFVYKMSEDEKACLKAQHERILSEALEAAPDMLILDEALDAVSLNVLDIDALLNAVDTLKEKTEIVITGHVVIDGVFNRADYITHMVKERHPYDKGIKARKGVEF